MADSLDPYQTANLGPSGSGPVMFVGLSLSLL